MQDGFLFNPLLIIDRHNELTSSGCVCVCVSQRDHKCENNLSLLFVVAGLVLVRVFQSVNSVYVCGSDYTNTVQNVLSQCECLMKHSLLLQKSSVTAEKFDEVGSASRCAPVWVEVLLIYVITRISCPKTGTCLWIISETFCVIKQIIVLFWNSNWILLTLAVQ